MQCAQIGVVGILSVVISMVAFANCLFILCVILVLPVPFGFIWLSIVLNGSEIMNSHDIEKNY
jgi:hypothetical protein